MNPAVRSAENRRLTHPRISRRAVLRGFGTAVALPFLGSLGPARAWAAAPASAGSAPRRLAFIFVPNGVHMPDWRPRSLGALRELPWTLEPLRNVRDELTVISGLAHDKGRPNGDGAGDHARSASVFITGAQPTKTPGANIQSGRSADQIAAQAIGRHTRFPSLELAVDGGGNTGNCDSGYSCAYSNNISWAAPDRPMAKETDPRKVFERLFAGGSAREAAAVAEERERRRRSVLDYVLGEARTLQSRLGGADRRKLDEYLAGIRAVERQMELAIRDGRGTLVEPDGLPPQPGAELSFEDHTRLMTDLMVLAFQGDATRIATFMFARAGSNRSYKPIGVSDGHHDLSHHQGQAAKQEKIRRINRHHVELFARFLERLKAIPEGGGTLLDHCMIVYGSGLGDGNRHNHDDLPILLAGRGGGTIDSGRHLVVPGETPVCNLLLSLLYRAGVDPAAVPALGDSTGTLDELVF